MDTQELDEISSSRGYNIIISKQTNGDLLVRYLDENSKGEFGGPFFKEFTLGKEVTLEPILNILRTLE